MDETELVVLEKQLTEKLEGPSGKLAKEERMKRQLEALREVVGTITDPEDIAAFEEAAKRRPFFRSRKLDIKP